MLIAVSGSQGCGKTTTLNELKKLGHNVIERKTSRSILSDWDVTLQEVNDNRELTLMFQDEILKRKHQDEIDAHNSTKLYFTERTFSDLFVYALVSLGKDNINSDWLDQYYNNCSEMNKMYEGVFYVQGGLFRIEHDGIRGSNLHYAKMVDLTMEHYTWQMNPKCLKVKSADLDNRVEYILDRTYNYILK